MKIFMLIIALALLAIIGIILLFRAGVSTHETVLAQVTAGNDRLILKYAYTTDWGNSLVSRQLWWNDRLVDFRGNMRYKNNQGHKVFPVNQNDANLLRVDVLAETGGVELAQMERARQNMTFIENSVNAEKLKLMMPQFAEIAPWTVWINPAEFSPEEYDRLKNLLTLSKETLKEQQQINEATTSGDTTEGFYSRFIGAPLFIWRTVYFDYTSLKPQTFRRTKNNTKETITIDLGGDISIIQRSDRYVAGFGCNLGQLNERADTIVIVPYWLNSDIYFPVAELSEFKDDQGRALTDQYKVVSGISPSDN